MQRGFAYSGYIVIILFLSFFVGFPDIIHATHEEDHRFTIIGYVRDGKGSPLSDALVLLEHKGGVKKETHTDTHGYYEVMFHLHNDNLGDEILVAVGDVVKKVSVQFDPDDRVTVRRSALTDFGAPGKANGDDLVYWVAGVVLIIVAVGSLRVFKKKKTRQKRRKKDKKRKRK
ncbi:MAG: hypothetical protein ACE5FZ_05715 [Nitrospiria bacterium]